MSANPGTLDISWTAMPPPETPFYTVSPDYTHSPVNHKPKILRRTSTSSTTATLSSSSNAPPKAKSKVSISFKNLALKAAAKRHTSNAVNFQREEETKDAAFWNGKSQDDKRKLALRQSLNKKLKEKLKEKGETWESSEAIDMPLDDDEAKFEQAIEDIGTPKHTKSKKKNIKREKSNLSSTSTITNNSPTESSEQTSQQLQDTQNLVYYPPGPFCVPVSPSSTYNLPYGYQMLYVPVQVPMSPIEGFLSPISETTSTPVSSKKSDKQSGPSASSVPQQPTPPTSGPTINNPHSNPLTNQAISFTSLFHPTLQSQLSNSQLFSQLGFSLSSGNLFSGSMQFSSGNPSNSPVIGLLVPSSSAPVSSAEVENFATPTHLVSDKKDAKLVRESPASQQVEQDDTTKQVVISPTTALLSLSPQTFYQFTFLQQKQLQMMAMQQGATLTAAAEENSGKTSSSGSSSSLLPSTMDILSDCSKLFKSGSLSVLLPVSGASDAVGAQKMHVNESLPKEQLLPQKRKRGSPKGKEKELSPEDIGPESSQKHSFSPIQFIPFMSQQLQHFQLQSDQSEKRGEDGSVADSEKEGTARKVMTPILSITSPEWLSHAGITGGFGFIMTENLPSSSHAAFIPFKGISSAMLASGSAEANESDSAKVSNHVLIPVTPFQPQNASIPNTGIIFGAPSGSGSESPMGEASGSRISPKLYGFH